MTDRELMQQALEALESLADTSWTAAFKQREYDSDEPNENVERERVLGVITALRERLAQPETVMAEYKFQTYAAYKTPDGEMKIGVVPETRRTTREEKILRPGVYEVPVEQEPVAGEYAVCLEDGERVLIASVLPVGYGGNKTRTVRVVWPDGMDGVYTLFQFAKLFSPVGERTTPPRREWVGLTGEEWAALGCKTSEEIRIGLAVQAKLKEKNQ